MPPEFDLLRRLAEDRDASMTDTLDAALESLRRERFYEEMAASEQRLRADPAARCSATRGNVGAVASHQILDVIAMITGMP